METLVKDRWGKIIGRMIDRPNRREIRTASGQILGFFEEPVNQTKNVRGQIVGFGDLRLTLIAGGHAR